MAIEGLPGSEGEGGESAIVSRAERAAEDTAKDLHWALTEKWAATVSNANLSTETKQALQDPEKNQDFIAGLGKIIGNDSVAEYFATKSSLDRSTTVEMFARGFGDGSQTGGVINLVQWQAGAQKEINGLKLWPEVIAGEGKVIGGKLTGEQIELKTRLKQDSERIYLYGVATAGLLRGVPTLATEAVSRAEKLIPENEKKIGRQFALRSEGIADRWQPVFQAAGEINPAAKGINDQEWQSWSAEKPPSVAKKVA